MHRTLLPALGLALVATVAARAEQRDPQDLNHLLHGTYTFSGSDTCLVSLIGFTPTLAPRPSTSPSSFVLTQTTQGTWTFNGDGTASSHAHSDTVVGAPFAGASSSDYTGNFTYNVAPDGTVSVQNDGPITGTILSGSRTDQTFSIDTSLLSGQVGLGGKGLTLATGPVPSVEVISYSVGSPQYRICARSRTLLKMSGDGDRD